MSNTMYWHPRWGIRMILEERGMLHKDLANDLDWPESRVSKLLSGKQTMTVEDLSKIANALNIDVGALFDPPNRDMGRYRGPLPLALTA